ncbi:unnamed protein product [Ophioblennius macclurei]
MRKTPLNFLSRKNQSLFDTNVKMREIDNVDFVSASSVVPESGTASVRARPTVKHHSSSSDTFQGFAVPTPKVPILPPTNGPKINGSVGGNHLYNGSVISIPDLVEGEILVPPHPSMAPPPPPGSFILPPPDFLGDLNSPELAGFQAQSGMNGDLSFMKPPSMAPPKVPSTGPASPAPVSSPTQTTVPQRPNYAPPLPPSDKQFKTDKTPPPKPMRFSSVQSLDSPPLTPAPPPPVKTPTLSTFNPQNTAKLYDVPRATGLGGYADAKPKQKLLMQDSVYANSTPKVAPPSKPALKDVQDLKETLRLAQPSKSPLPEVKTEATAGSVGISKVMNTPPHKSPQLLKVNGSVPSLESTKNKYQGSPDQNLKYSPLLDRKLRNIKSETNGPREGSVASPLALLKAAKEREKHRSSASSSLHEDSARNNGQPSTGVHLSDFSQNSSVTPQPTSYSYTPSNEERLQEMRKSALMDNTQKVLAQAKYDSNALVKSQTPSPPTLSHITSTAPSVRNLVDPKPDVRVSPLRSQPAQHEANQDGANIAFLPPPPGFDDFMEAPPSILPPNPPMKKAPTPTVATFPQAPAAPPPPPPPPPTSSKAVPPPLAKLPVPDFDVKLRPTPQTSPKPTSAQLPATLSPSQVTLLSILQKKMLEIDQKMSPTKEADNNSDDWGSPLSDEENHAPVVPKVKPQIKSYPVGNKAATLDLKELENKMARKPPQASSVKLPTPSNGPQQQQSKHQYGMTLTVRPGTRNPITVVRRGDP